ncbi:guanylate kinase [SAR202 cluster bacterium AD-802-E10_MRT_200m]|nr:guanylate kinase [SAR202 cluster bacterium AD-802-E10_MRT_200m]
MSEIVQKDIGKTPLVVVLSGPSGVGKDAVIAHLRTLGRPYHSVVTATTRPKRYSEKEGIDYIFLSPDEFDQMLADDEFMEWAQVYGNRYGVPKNQVRDALKRGQDVIIKIDVQGAATIKTLAPQAVFIFLAPTSLSELETRLKDRKTEADTDINLRLRTAKAEMGHRPMFDYVVLNRDGLLGQTVKEVEAIIEKEKSRCPPRLVEL